MVAFDCQCRKGARCLACIEANELLHTRPRVSADPLGPARGIAWGVVFGVLLWALIIAIVFFAWHV